MTGHNDSGAPSWSWGQRCPRCGSSDVRRDQRGRYRELSCTACRHRWVEQLPADPRRHRVPLGVFVGLLIGVLAAGGGVVAFGALAKGNPTALLPWAPAPSTPAAVTARTVSLPTPPLPTATLPQPGVRPIIFLPGIAGSYLADGTQELWPNVPGVASTLDCSLSGASPNVATQVQLFSSLALSSDGMPLPGSTVGVANGVEEPVLPAGDSTLGGVFTEEFGHRGLRRGTELPRLAGRGEDKRNRIRLRCHRREREGIWVRRGPVG